jgi:hypothetical protein
MGWLPQSDFDATRAAALALTPAEREALTWDDACQFVVADTLEWAKWSRLKRSGCTPWEAVARLHWLNGSHGAGRGIEGSAWAPK